jgi:hypothetical protein
MLEKNLAAVELFNHNRRLGKAADLETVRQAVVESGCDRSIVYDTLTAANMWNKNGLLRHSPELHAWCETQLAKGNLKGEWLRAKLEESSIWSGQAMAQSKLAESQIHVGIKRGPLSPKTGDYDGGLGDQLVVHELEWNKVRKFFISTHRVVVSSQSVFPFTGRLSSCFTSHINLCHSLSIRNSCIGLSLLEVKTHRGWLILNSWGYTSQTVTHNLSWSQVMRETGPRMYCGPIRPRRLACWTEHDLATRSIILWLAPPASKPLKLSLSPIVKRRVQADGL